jgi:cytochrome P450 PksS
MTAHVDFTSQAFFRDPAAGIERLRTLGPVVETRFPIVGKVWITTTYDSTARVLKDGETFTLRKDGGGVAGLRWWMPAFVGALANSMLTMDEPDHTRLRQIVDEAFRRRAVLDMEPRIRAIADDLAGKLFADAPRPTSSRATRDCCRCRSSASCWACRWPTARGSSPGPTRWRGSPGSPISCA